MMDRMREMRILSQKGEFEKLAEIMPWLLYANDEHRFVVVRSGFKSATSVMYAANYILTQSEDGFKILKNREGGKNIRHIAKKVFGFDFDFVEGWERGGIEHEHTLVPRHAEDRMFLKLGGMLI